MKRVLIGILAIILFVTLTGCGSSKNETNKNTNTGESKYKKVLPETTPSVQYNCENCVFAFVTERISIGDKLTGYTKDYSSLKDSDGKQRIRFLGFVLNPDETIQQAFACAIENGKMFCIEGTKDGSKYESNLAIIKSVYDEKKCSTRGMHTVCSGTVNSNIKKNGFVSTSERGSCSISESGEISCM